MHFLATVGNQPGDVVQPLPIPHDAFIAVPTDDPDIDQHPCPRVEEPRRLGPRRRLQTQGGLTDPGVTRDENEPAVVGAKHGLDVGEGLVAPESTTAQIKATDRALART